jgi:endonuclease G
MPGSAVVHAAVFTAGALLGGGIAVAVTSKRNLQHPVLPTRPAPLPVPIPAPRQEQTSVPPTFVGKDMIPSPALRYGNPGEWYVFSMVDTLC